MKNNRIFSKETLHSGNFLQISKLQYRDHNGISRIWESCERVNSFGAAVIIALTDATDEVVIIEQFRPPANKVVVEFPAGLIDENESAAEAAVRELEEETGFKGKVDSLSRPVYNSPGLTGETIIFVKMTIPLAQNRNPQPKMEESENITTHLIKKSELKEFLARKEAAGCAIDAKLYTWSLSI